MGRSQVVRQRILVPPCGGSNPPAPANDDLARRYFNPRSKPRNSSITAAPRVRQLLEHGAINFHRPAGAFAYLQLSGCHLVN